MFIDQQKKDRIDNYVKLLTGVGALSKLFSENDQPYLYYRAAENIFCRAFTADNLSRSDASADARKNKTGIGLKTFLNTKKGSSFQKIAEFNKTRELYIPYQKDSRKLTSIVSDLRNKRLDSTKEIHGVEDMIYHSVVRDKEVFYISEEPMKNIDVENISGIVEKSNTIYFNDGSDEYNFNLSKSTLYKRFNTNSILDIDISIIKDPFGFLETLWADLAVYEKTAPKYEEIVYLPLFSTRGEKKVPEKSGLNQWNAGGRERHAREVYIPIPKWIHDTFPTFFPERDKPFKLKLSDGLVLDVKVCQENSKALMSNPNSDLGKWILDDILNIPEGELVTLDMLNAIGIDSVEIRKIDDDNFEIDFKETGTYEAFFSENAEQNVEEDLE